MHSWTFTREVRRRLARSARGYQLAGALGIIVMAPLASAAAPPATEPVTTVRQVDLDRYVGQWYEVARYPNRFQEDCARNVRATYAKRPDGRLDVLNQCETESGETKRAQGVARVVDERSRAKLKVRFAPAALSFLPFVWGDYWVIGLADDYSWAVVGSPDRKYLWILSRTPAPAASAYDAAIGRARANGFDTARLVRTVQSPQGEM